MASVLQVATIKDQGGNANAIEIANSSANVTINNLTSSTGFPAGHIVGVQSAYATDTSASDYEFSVNANTTGIGSVTLGTNYSTSVLSSASNKLIVSLSFIVSTSSTTSGDHWRFFLNGTGIPKTHTYSGADGYPLNSNFHYAYTHYIEHNLSAMVFVTPGQNNPVYKIDVLKAGSGGSVVVKNIHWVFMEVKA